MTPTDTIIALEKALEDQLRRLQEFAHDEVSVHVTRGQLRTLLDAHASALRDAVELRKALGEISWSNDSKWQSDRADKALNRTAALDDNTKGAAE